MYGLSHNYFKKFLQLIATVLHENTTANSLSFQQHIHFHNKCIGMESSCLPTNGLWNIVWNHATIKQCTSYSTSTCKNFKMQEMCCLQFLINQKWACQYKLCVAKQ